MKRIESLIRLHERAVERLSKIAETANTETTALESLSRVQDPRVEAAVSMNPRTSSVVLEKMLARFCGVGGEDDERRIHIVWNPSLRLSVLKNCCLKDPSLEVRQAAIASLVRRLAVLPGTKASELQTLHSLLGGTTRRSAKARMPAMEAVLRVRSVSDKRRKLS